MNHSKISSTLITTLITTLTITLMLSGCGGQKLNKKQQASSHDRPLMSANNDHVMISIEDVLIKNSPSSWVKNANWDEYVIRIKPKINDGVQINSIHIIDTFGDQIDKGFSRKHLNKSSKAIKKKYRKAGYEVKIGQTQNNAIIDVTAASGLGAAAGSTVSSAYIGTASSAAAGAVVLFIPVAIVTGVVRSVNHRKVQQVLNEKNVVMPKRVAASGEVMSFIFPAVPSPKHLIITYETNDVIHEIDINLTELLTGIHLKANIQ